MNDFETGLELLRRHLDSAREGSFPTEAILADLERAHKELVVAHEEIRAHDLEFRRLIQAQRLGTWQHERLLAILPVAVLVSDAAGVIHTVNAAAASMLRTPADRLIRKPIFSFVDYHNRADLRSRLSTSVRSEGELRAKIMLLPRNAAPRVVEAVASVGRDAISGTTDVTWLLMAQEPTELSVHVAGPEPTIRALVELSKLPLHDHGDVEMLRRAASICSRAIGHEASVTVTVGNPAAPAALASTDGLAQHVDGAQVVADEGPCVAAWNGRVMVTSDDLAVDPRWPDLTRRLDPSDVRGGLAVPIQLGDELIGVLNIYLPEDPPDEETVDVASLLATAVAAILHEVAIKAALAKTAEELQNAMASRSQIEQAKGIVMAAYGVDEERAFRLLVDRSNHENVKLRELARRIVEDPGSRP